jgi:hypothetical protein
MEQKKRLSRFSLLTKSNSLNDGNDEDVMIE